MNIQESNSIEMIVTTNTNNVTTTVDSNTEINRDIDNKQIWYTKSKEHWEKSEPSVKGVLGGNDEVHSADVKTSCELLEGLIKTNKIKSQSVIDCGAGIGRVTTSVLLNYFEECDILEQDEKFVEHCKSTFKDNPKVKNIYQSPLQSFNFEKLYDVIWIQWCVENLDDEDLSNFLKKCKNSLSEGGVIIMKENIVLKGSKFLTNDYSRVRSDILFKRVIDEVGLKIFRHFHQPNWPKNYLKVSIFVLKN